MTSSAEKQTSVFMLAGPNGAGKTSLANRFLPDFVNCREFLNADLIAAGLAPFAPESQALRASDIMLARIRELVDERVSFGFETTLAGRSYRQLIPDWSDSGFRVVLLFLWLPSANLAVERVAERVRQGGHDISESDIRRRFDRGLRNLFALYLPCVDDAYVYNASQLPPVLVWERQSGQETFKDTATWQLVLDSAKAAS